MSSYLPEFFASPSLCLTGQKANHWSWVVPLWLEEWHDSSVNWTFNKQTNIKTCINYMLFIPVFKSLYLSSSILNGLVFWKSNKKFFLLLLKKQHTMLLSVCISWAEASASVAHNAFCSLLSPTLYSVAVKQLLMMRWFFFVFLCLCRQRMWEKCVAELFLPSHSLCFLLFGITFVLSSGVFPSPDAELSAGDPAESSSSRIWCSCSPASAWFHCAWLGAAHASSDTGLAISPSVQTLHPVRGLQIWVLLSMLENRPTAVTQGITLL